MKFEWDENKNQLNIRKHGISFYDAAYVFSDPFALSIPDDYHSETEYLNEKCLNKQENLQILVNDLLRKDIEIAKRMTL
jgi:uncharacterized DUF497 family protein